MLTLLNGKDNYIRIPSAWRHQVQTTENTLFCLTHTWVERSSWDRHPLKNHGPKTAQTLFSSMDRESTFDPEDQELQEVD